MEIRDIQLMIQQQAMSILTSNNNTFTSHSPMVDLAFRQLLQEKIDNATTLTNKVQQNSPKVSNYTAMQPIAVANTGSGIPATQFDTYINEFANKYGIDKKLIHSVIKNESNYNEMARSNAGDRKSVV